MTPGVCADRSFIDACEIKADLTLTIPCGGGSGHGGRLALTLWNIAGADMGVRVRERPDSEVCSLDKLDKEIRREFRKMDREDARWVALTACKNKRRAIRAALKHPEGCRMSSRDIAVYLGVDEDLVRYYRRGTGLNEPGVRFVITHKPEMYSSVAPGAPL